MNITSEKSVIIGLKRLVIGFAKINDIQGSRKHRGVNKFKTHQLIRVISIFKTLEKLTCIKFENTNQLEIVT